MTNIVIKQAVSRESRKNVSHKDSVENNQTLTGV